MSCRCLWLETRNVLPSAWLQTGIATNAKEGPQCKVSHLRRSGRKPRLSISTTLAVHHAVENKLNLDEVRSWIPELKKWLAMVAHKPDNDYVIFGPVDALWHTFICFTRDYEAMIIDNRRFLHCRTELHPKSPRLHFRYWIG